MHTAAEVCEPASFSGSVTKPEGHGVQDVAPSKPELNSLAPQGTATTVASTAAAAASIAAAWGAPTARVAPRGRNTYPGAFKHAAAALAPRRRVNVFAGHLFINWPAPAPGIGWLVLALGQKKCCWQSTQVPPVEGYVPAGQTHSVWALFGTRGAWQDLQRVRLPARCTQEPWAQNLGWGRRQKAGRALQPLQYINKRKDRGDYNCKY
jgi:hypothetical protein